MLSASLKKMLKIIFYFSLMFYFLHSSSLKISDAEISSISLHKDLLYISTNQGKIKIYHLKKQSFLKDISLPKDKDFFGNLIIPKIYQSHTNDHNQTLIVASNASSTRDLWLYSNSKLIPLLQNMEIQKAFWINPTQIIIALLSHEIILYSTQDHQIHYSHQISQSSLNDCIYNQKDHLIYSAGESGIIYAINPDNGNILQTFESHKDRIYQLAFYDQYLISGGADQKVNLLKLSQGIHTLESKNIHTNFLVYAVGAEKGFFAYLANEKGQINLVSFDLKRHFTLGNIKGIANTILFYKNQIIIGTDSQNIYFFTRSF